MKRKTKLLQVRITDEQYEKFKSYANKNDLTKSEIIRGFIKRVTRKVTVSSS